MNEKHKKAIALGLAGIAALGAGVAIGANSFAKETVVTKEVIKEVPKEVIKEVPVEVVKEVTVASAPVYVDNGKLADVMEFLWLQKGDAQIIYEDLDDDEKQLAVNYFVMGADFLALAENEVRAEWSDLLDGEMVNGTKLDEDDLRSLSIEEDDVKFLSADFEDGDARIEVPIKFRMDDDKFQAVLVVTIREGEVDDLDIDSIEPR